MEKKFHALIFSANDTFRLIIFFQYHRITRNVEAWAPVARVSKSKDCLSSGRHRDTVVRVGTIASRTEANIGFTDTGWWDWHCTILITLDAYTVEAKYDAYLAYL